MFKRSRSMSILYRYIMSFLMISMIPLFVVSIFFYRYNLDAVRKNVQHLNGYQLTQITNIFEREFEEYFFIAKRLEQEPKLGYKSLTGTWIERKEALDAFQYHMVDAVNTGDPFLFVRGEDIVYSKGGTMDYDAMSSKYYTFTADEKERFYKWLNETNVPAVDNLQTYELTGNVKKEKVVFQFPIRNKRVTVVFVVNKNYYLGLFSNMIESMEGYAFVFDNIYNTVATNSQNKVDCLTVSNFLKIESNDKNAALKLSDDETYTITSIRSPKTGWICAIALPESMYHFKSLKEINSLNLVFTVVGFICTGVGIALSFLYYKPLRRIIQETDIDKNTAGGNEYDMISGYFKWTTAQNRVLREMISSQTPYVKDRVLDILLYSDIPQEEFEQETKNIDLGFKEPYFFVITLELDGTLNAAEHSHHVKEIMGKVNKLQKNPVVPCSIYCMEHLGEKEPSLIVNIRDKSYKEPIFAQIKSELEKLSRQYAKLAFGCGNIYDCLWGLRKSYQEAKVVSEHNIRFKGKEVSVIDEIQKSDNMGIPDFPVSIQSLFVQQVKEGDFRGAQDSFAEFCESEALQQSGDTLQQYVFACIVRDIVNLAKEVGCTVPECGLPFLLTYKNMQVLREKILLAAKEICKTVNKNNYQKSNELKKRIVCYIKENYRDPNLGLDSMGEHFGFSPVYLSRLIREQTGLNFKEYVTDVRIQKAKKLLMDTDISINDIVVQIGYYNTSSFIRKFRNIEGITPGEYRTRMQKKEVNIKHQQVEHI